MNKKMIVILLSALLIITAAVLGWYLLVRDTTQPASNTGKQTTEQKSDTKPDNKTSPGDTDRERARTYQVSVYFSKHPDSDDDPSKTFAVARTSPDLGVARFALSELIKGPTAEEKLQGYFTTIGFREGESTCGSDFTLRIENGTARLQFCKQFDHRGIVADGQADSEIKATLRQFDSVQKVIILNQRGDCEFDLSGENKCLE
jgi:hypothetical protein